MDNSFYLLYQSNAYKEPEKIFDIHRLQVCTWNTKDIHKSFVELGIEIHFKEDVIFPLSEIKIAFFAEFLKENDKLYYIHAL